MSRVADHFVGRDPRVQAAGVATRKDARDAFEVSG